MVVVNALATFSRAARRAAAEKARAPLGGWTPYSADGGLS